MNESLFSHARTWHAAPAEAFAALLRAPGFALGEAPQGQGAGAVSGKTLRDSSARVYQAMFGRFLRFLAENERGFHDTRPEDVLAFLSALEHDGAASRIRWRYLRLLERAWHAYCVAPGAQPGPDPVAAAVRELIRDQELQAAGGRDQPMSWLDDADQARIAATLHTLASASARRARRDAALVALMLGGGLKLSEALGLRADAVQTPDADGSVAVEVAPWGGSARAHRTLVRAFLATPVLGWVAECRTAGAHAQLFPPGKVSARAARGARATLDPASAYRRVRAVLATAGVSAAHQGGRTLRNSFAVRELGEGASEELLMERMGHRRLRSTRRYARDGNQSG